MRGREQDAARRPRRERCRRPGRRLWRPLKQAGQRSADGAAERRVPEPARARSELTERQPAPRQPWVAEDLPREWSAV
jgi:hypothetical protein